MRRPAQLPPGGVTKRDDWGTPDWLFRQLNHEFGPFTLDAAASAENAKCADYFDEEHDGLAQPWSGRVWVNPPYKHTGQWVAKAEREARSGRADVVVMLLPARTGTSWFHTHVLGKSEIRWLRGRLSFGGVESNAPFDSMIVVFRNP